MRGQKKGKYEDSKKNPSGESLEERTFMRKTNEKFKKMYPANSIIFAPVSYCNKSFNKINKFTNNIRLDIRSKYQDLFIGNNPLKDMKLYLKLLPKLQSTGFLYAKSCGYDVGLDAIAFPHVIPDNCPDIAGFLFKKLLKSEKANKTTIEFQKECRIESFSDIK